MLTPYMPDINDEYMREKSGLQTLPTLWSRAVVLTVTLT